MAIWERNYCYTVKPQALAAVIGIHFLLCFSRSIVSFWREGGSELEMDRLVHVSTAGPMIETETGTGRGLRGRGKSDPRAAAEIVAGISMSDHSGEHLQIS